LDFLEVEMPRKLFGKFWIQDPGWTDDRFAWHWVPDQISGMDYAGLTLFGWSLLYSDHW
jgi:hypothetical protein